MARYTLGLFYLFHDASACLLKDGQVVAMAEEERFDRKKHSFALPENAIHYCLKEAGINFSDIHVIAFGIRPVNFLLYQVKSALMGLPQSLNLLRPGASYMPLSKKISGMFRIKQKLERIFGQSNAKLTYIDHHVAHAYSAFVPSGFGEAAVFIADGFGEETATSFFVAKDQVITPFHNIPLPFSLGVYYGAVTQFLGFRPHGDEYKVMGMAAYGTNSFVDVFSRMLWPTKDLNFAMDMEYVDFYKFGIRKWFSDKMIEALGTPRANGDAYDQRHFDIARSAQTQLEETVIAMLQQFRNKTGLKNLCLAGGVAQNVLMNRRILDESGFENVYVPPMAYDGGISLGAALSAFHRGSQKALSAATGLAPAKLANAALGPQFTDVECEAILKVNKIEFKEIKSDLDDLVDLIAAGKVVGVFDGKLEVGPRALGRRSIIADPRQGKMVDILNARIKRREFFRPFAPAVPLDECNNYFDLGHESPFMTMVAKVKAPETLPAITHADGTARVQTVTHDSNPNFYRLLKAFGSRTGIPVLINTSFNENEPIVCSPQEAVDCFLRTKMDALVFNYRYIAVRSNQLEA